MPRTVVAALVVAGALALSGFSCGGIQEPPPNPFTCSAQIRGAVTEDLWCFAGTFDYTQFPDGGIPEWALDIPLYRGSPFGPALPEVAGGVGAFTGGPPTAGVSYGWDGGSAPNVTAGGAFRYAGFAPPDYGVITHEMVVPLSWPDLAESGKGTMSITFSVVPAPTDFLGAHGVVDATLPAVDGVGAPVTLKVFF